MKKKGIILMIMLCCLVYVYGQNKAVLDIGGLRASVRSNGSLFRAGLNEGFFVPETASYSLFKEANLWAGGIDATGQLKNGVYQDNQKVWAFGPIMDFTDASYSNWDRVWKINKAEIDAHILNWNSLNYQVPASISEWPGNPDYLSTQQSGCTSWQSPQLAPYHDANNNQTYDPQNGDYPLIKGDQCIFFIMNDAKPSIEVSERIPMEVHGMLYCYNAPNDSILNRTAFLHYDIYYRGIYILNDAYLSMMADFEIGAGEDDYVGCDTLAQYFYGYNGDNQDSLYGVDAPPAVAVAFLNQEMKHFITYEKGGIGVTGQPNLNIDYYVYQRALWKDGNGIALNTTNGYPITGNEAILQYIYPGEVCNSTGWSEISAGNSPSDRLGLGSTEAHTFLPGAYHTLDLAFVYAKGNNYTESVCALQDAVAHIKSINQTVSLLPPKLLEVAAAYPNPNNGTFRLRLSPIKASELYIEVFDMAGKLLFSQQENVSTESFEKEYILPQLSKGTYLLKVSASKQQQTIKLCVW